MTTCSVDAGEATRYQHVAPVGTGEDPARKLEALVSHWSCPENIQAYFVTYDGAGVPVPPAGQPAGVVGHAELVAARAPVGGGLPNAPFAGGARFSMDILNRSLGLLAKSLPSAKAIDSAALQVASRLCS
eukprot:683575-Amphidinium_carterae.2